MAFLDIILNKISHDIGVDLGTANTLIFLKDKGVIINEPSVVAINQKTKQVLAIGLQAQDMIGKTPAHIVASRPLVDGVVSDFEMTEIMLSHFIEKLNKTNFALLPRPRLVIGIPSGVTEVEKRAVLEAGSNAGARATYLIEEPMAAAIGAGIDIKSSHGNMIVDIGGGTSEIAVINLGGIVSSRSLRVAGDELTQDIINFAKEEFGLQIGERTAEKIKIDIGNVYSDVRLKEMSMRGRDMITGLPKEVMINTDQTRVALYKSITPIIESIKLTLEETPPELVSDIMQSGIVLAGGGALLGGLDQLIANETQMPVKIAKNPLQVVALGTGVVLEDLDNLKSVLINE
jgi:rod shape-determining protein MreB